MSVNFASAVLVAASVVGFGMLPYSLSAAAAANEVLILGSTVSGGTGSLEAQRVTTDGYTPVVIDDATWEAMTTAQFASYRGIVIGDPTCGSYGDTSQLTAALSNPTVWGAAVNGNVLIIGTDPVFHATLGGRPGAAQLVANGIDFALAQSGKVGAYIDLSCAFGTDPPNTPVTLLDGIRAGGFTVDGAPSSLCYNDAHIVATHPALAGLTDADLSGWSCSVHEAFDTWPGDYTVLAMARNLGSSFTASDGTIGTPYILASGLGLHSYPLSLSPAGQSVPAGTEATVTATLLDTTTGTPAAGVAISFRVSGGPNTSSAGVCVPTSCVTDATGSVSWTYSGARLGADTVQAWLDANHNGTPDPGEAQTTAGVTWIVPPACQDAGQMQTQASYVYPAATPSNTLTRWHVDYGISKCEGLVIDGATLGVRLMAERMSVPYVNLELCNEPTVGCNSSADVTKYHIELKPSADESTATSYAFVQLLTGPSTTVIKSPSSSPCNGQPPCEHASISAVYRVWLTPPSVPDTQRTYLDITQNYEFYHEFNESTYRQLACEPAADQGIGPIQPLFLASCARWKPLVSYEFHPNGSTLDVLSFNAVQRLHYTPDAMATRSVAVTRDCDPGYPTAGCNYGAGRIEAYAPGNETKAIPNDLVFLAYNSGDVIYPQDGLGNPDNLPGRYDNLHVTANHEASIPDPLPPGCLECVHMHWRWGSSIAGSPSQYPQFGGGQPLVGNCTGRLMVCGPGTSNPGGEIGPGVVANPYSRQQMFVAVTNYHSDQLAPYAFMDAVRGANILDVSTTGTSSNPYPGYPNEGFSQGTQTLSHDPPACFDASNPTSWGQCGQVVWLSARTLGVLPHDEDADTLFAFGGFFCATCPSSDYLQYQALRPISTPAVSAGQPFRVIMATISEPTSYDVYDVLPAGSSNVSVQYPQGTGMSCATSVGGSGVYTIHCSVPALFAQPPCPGPNPSNPNPCVIALTITANAPTTTGTYENVVHVVWSGGNFRPTATLTVT